MDIWKIKFIKFINECKNTTKKKICYMSMVPMDLILDIKPDLTITFNSGDLFNVEIYKKYLLIVNIFGIEANLREYIIDLLVSKKITAVYISKSDPKIRIDPYQIPRVIRTFDIIDLCGKKSKDELSIRIINIDKKLLNYLS